MSFTIRMSLHGKVVTGTAAKEFQAIVRRSIEGITNQLEMDVAKETPVGVGGKLRAGVARKMERWHRGKVYEKGPGSKYVEPVEKGRKGGKNKKFPPPKAIELWLRRTDKGKAFVQSIKEKYKIKTQKQALKQATFLKSRGIARLGTRAVNMFKKTFNKRKRWAQDKLKRDIAKFCARP